MERQVSGAKIQERVEIVSKAITPRHSSWLACRTESLTTSLATVEIDRIGFSAAYGPMTALKG